MKTIQCSYTNSCVIHIVFWEYWPLGFLCSMKTWKSFKEHTSNSLRVAMIESIYCSNIVQFCCDIVSCKRSRQPAFLLGWYKCLAGVQRHWHVCWTILYSQNKLCSCSHKQAHFTNAFCILSVYEVGYQTADQSSLMICARLCNIYDSNLRSRWTCTVLWHGKVNPCEVWHQCSLFLMYKHHGVSHYPSQSVSLTALWMGQW